MHLRPSLLARFALVLSFSVVGCGGSSMMPAGGGGGGGGGTLNQPLEEDGKLCSGATGSGGACTGGVCISLTANDQHESGICTTACTTSCATDELCVGGFPDGGSYCLRTCASSADCFDGFACVQDTVSGDAFCWVTTTGAGGAGGAGGGGAGGGGAGGGGGGGGHVDCTGCDMLTDVAGYCGSVPGSTQVCDCPYGSPSPSCTATPGAANTWCCP